MYATTCLVVLLFFSGACFSKNVELTFKNVTFRGYSLFALKFTKTIESSNSLREHLPKSAYDKIEFMEQNVPILYKNSIADIENLDELVIENCDLYEIRPGAFKNVPQLRRLSLKGNKLEAIKSGVFNTLSISTLDLSRNALTEIDSTAFDNLPELLNIQLSDNKIASWDSNWFYNTPLLTRVSLQNNSIEKLPGNAFKNLKGDKKFGSLELTINLVFSYNRLKDIDAKAFEGLTKINNLWLDNNRIETFSDKLLENVNVKDLRINGNNIRCLEGDLSKIIKAENTHLDSNPYDCGCLKKFKTWAEEHEKQVDLFYSDLTCDAERIKTKMAALNKRLKELRKSDAKEEDNIETLK